MAVCLRERPLNFFTSFSPKRKRFLVEKRRNNKTTTMSASLKRFESVANAFGADPKSIRSLEVEVGQPTSSSPRSKRECFVCDLLTEEASTSTSSAGDGAPADTAAHNDDDLTELMKQLSSVVVSGNPSLAATPGGGGSTTGTSSLPTPPPPLMNNSDLPRNPQKMTVFIKICPQYFSTEHLEASCSYVNNECTDMLSAGVSVQFPTYLHPRDEKIGDGGKNTTNNHNGFVLTLPEDGSRWIAMGFIPKAEDLKNGTFPRSFPRQRLRQRLGLGIGALHGTWSPIYIHPESGEYMTKPRAESCSRFFPSKSMIMPPKVAARCSDDFSDENGVWIWTGSVHGRIHFVLKRLNALLKALKINEEEVVKKIEEEEQQALEEMKQQPPVSAATSNAEGEEDEEKSGEQTEDVNQPAPTKKHLKEFGRWSEALEATALVRLKRHFTMMLYSSISSRLAALDLYPTTGDMQCKNMMLSVPDHKVVFPVNLEKLVPMSRLHDLSWLVLMDDDGTGAPKNEADCSVAWAVETQQALKEYVKACPQIPLTDEECCLFPHAVQLKAAMIGVLRAGDSLIKADALEGARPPASSSSSSSSTSSSGGGRSTKIKDVDSMLDELEKTCTIRRQLGLALWAIENEDTIRQIAVDVQKSMENTTTNYGSPK